MGELSTVELQRIAEYQLALVDGTEEEVEDAEGKLLALGIDPEEARRTRVDPRRLRGDR